MVMSNDNRQLLKGIGIYAIGTFGTKILLFLIVPLYTYYISTSEMGLYDILMSTVNLLAPIITLQISDASYRWLIRDDVLDKTKYIRETLHVLIINCSIAVIIILLVNQLYTIPYSTYFCIVLVLNRILQTIQKILRGIKNQWLFAMSGIVFTVVFLFSNVIQLCVLKKGIESLFQSQIIANITALILIFVLEPKLRFNYFEKPDIRTIIEMYRYSIPLVPNYLNWWIINSSDRYIALAMLGVSANGILAIAHKFPSMLQAVLNLFNNSWQDISVSDTQKRNDTYNTSVFKNYYVITLAGLLCIVPATKIIILLIMSDSYKASCDFVAFYYLGTVFQSFSSFYGVGYLRNKQTNKAFSTSIYGAVANAAVNIILIRHIGLQAAAVSTFIGFLIMWLVREKQNRDELEIKIDWFEFIIYTTLAIGFSILSIQFDIYGNILLFVLGLVIFAFRNRMIFQLLLSRLQKIG